MFVLLDYFFPTKISPILPPSLLKEQLLKILQWVIYWLWDFVVFSLLVNDILYSYIRPIKYPFVISAKEDKHIYISFDPVQLTFQYQKIYKASI